MAWLGGRACEQHRVSMDSETGVGTPKLCPTRFSSPTHSSSFGQRIHVARHRPSRRRTAALAELDLAAHHTAVCESQRACIRGATACRGAGYQQTYLVVLAHPAVAGRTAPRALRAAGCGSSPGSTVNKKKRLCIKFCSWLEIGGDVRVLSGAGSEGGHGVQGQKDQQG